MPPKITEFECHATYIRDYGFEMVKKLGLQEAFDLLTASPYIDRTMKPKSWTPHPREISVGHEPEAYFLFNKGWSVVEVDRQKGIVRAVYNADGRYGLWQTGMHDFLKRIAQSRSWHTAFGKLYDELAQPHENA